MRERGERFREKERGRGREREIERQRGEIEREREREREREGGGGKRCQVTGSRHITKTVSGTTRFVKVFTKTESFPGESIRPTLSSFQTFEITRVLRTWVKP